jgi:hypothetical protein
MNGVFLALNRASRPARNPRAGVSPAFFEKLIILWYVLQDTRFCTIVSVAADVLSTMAGVLRLPVQLLPFDA